MSDPYLQPPQSHPYQPAYGEVPVPHVSAYASGDYMTPRPPVSIKVIGIVGTVLGAWGTLSLAGSVVVVALLPAMHKMMSAYGPTYGAVQWGMAAVFGVTSAALLVGSIGCLVRAAWARRLMLAWAVVYPALAVIGLGVSIAYLVPTALAHPVRAMPAPQVLAAMMYGGAVLGVLVRLILPTFVLAYFRRAYVREAFEAGKVGG